MKLRLNIFFLKFQRDKFLSTKYTEVIEGYIETGYARMVPQSTDSFQSDQLDSNTSMLWYLPHHPVYHAHKPGKLRVVFDCSAIYRGTSLNDQLLKGPDLVNSLVGVLTRFREQRVAKVEDIEAMFHQVQVIEKDCNTPRFLWWPWGDISRDHVDYQMLVHIFWCFIITQLSQLCTKENS